jgi:hypothetical protein
MQLQRAVEILRLGLHATGARHDHWHMERGPDESKLPWKSMVACRRQRSCLGNMFSFCHSSMGGLDKLGSSRTSPRRSRARCISLLRAATWEPRLLLARQTVPHTGPLEHMMKPGHTTLPERHLITRLASCSQVVAWACHGEGDDGLAWKKAGSTTGARSTTE